MREDRSRSPTARCDVAFDVERGLRDLARVRVANRRFDVKDRTRPRVASSRTAAPSPHRHRHRSSATLPLRRLESAGSSCRPTRRRSTTRSPTRRGRRRTATNPAPPIRTRRSARGSSCSGRPTAGTPWLGRASSTDWSYPAANAAVAPAASRSAHMTATATRRTGTPSRRRSWAMAATTPVHVRASGRRFRHSLPPRSGDQIRPGGHCVILLGCLPRSRRYRQHRRRLENLPAKFLNSVAPDSARRHAARPLRRAFPTTPTLRHHPSPSPNRCRPSSRADRGRVGVRTSHRSRCRAAPARRVARRWPPPCLSASACS